jgi:hypothetical protein
MAEIENPFLDFLLLLLLPLSLPRPIQTLRVFFIYSDSDARAKRVRKSESAGCERNSH